MTRSNSDPQAAFRLLPSIDEVMRDPRALVLARRLSRDDVQHCAARIIDAWRAEVRAGRLSEGELEARRVAGTLFTEIEKQVERELARGVVRCVNATGVVLNTGLGRAPVHREAADAMAEAARSYCVLEVDRETNERNQRDDYLGDLLARATGAEAGIGVNNCAAAVLLMFQTFAGGREAIVSRGELVEIGGSFRVPDVMARANAKLVEVGTTNRTRIADYERAITERTGLLVKVHTSNFKQIGFVEEVAPRDLAALGAEKKVVTGFDLGSGLLEIAGAKPLQPILGNEPLVRDAVASGVDVVCFSGDKLLGGPQAGLIVGKRAAIASLRKNPIYRAVRLDKVTLAGLEKTLELVRDGRADEIPARAMLNATAAELKPHAEALARRLMAFVDGTVAVIAERSQPGSGAAPDIFLDTFCVAIESKRLGATALALELRRSDPPVFTRIQSGRVLIDPRTLLPGDEDDLVRAFQELAGRTDPAARRPAP
ncbi:MAG: L-seryl-tRNA(Sec) selenium transferase [Planctomycetota bacterium]|nr:L-seryl-tRNA(Sec) selenium transferase [Planctomycetota bacterium]